MILTFITCNFVKLNMSKIKLVYKIGSNPGGVKPKTRENTSIHDINTFLFYYTFL